MAIPIFQNPPVSSLDQDKIVQAALGLYSEKEYALKQKFYEDDGGKCIKAVAGRIMHFADQIEGCTCPKTGLDKGAQVGTLSGHPLLHATETCRRKGNCSIICEYISEKKEIVIHAIGGHKDMYRYDGVSGQLHQILMYNQKANRGVRYADRTYDCVKF